MIGSSVAHLCYITRRVLGGGRQVFAGLIYPDIYGQKRDKGSQIRDKIGRNSSSLVGKFAQKCPGDLFGGYFGGSAVSP
jgi:hypothetical protein